MPLIFNRRNPSIVIRPQPSLNRAQAAWCDANIPGLAECRAYADEWRRRVIAVRKARRNASISAALRRGH